VFVMVALLHLASNFHLFLRWIAAHVASGTGLTVLLSALNLTQIHELIYTISRQFNFRISCNALVGITCV